MKLKKLQCPECGAGFSMDVKGEERIFCPFCGNQYYVDDGNRFITKNINIHKKTYIHKRYTDDAAIERERRLDREDRRQHSRQLFDSDNSILFVVFGLLFFIIMFCLISLKIWDTQYRQEQNAKKEAGMIQAGQSSEDIIGQNFQVVVQEFEAAGFTNISTVDLDDAGWFRNKADTVASVSIAGVSHFYSSDYFEPNAKIVISYH